MVSSKQQTQQEGLNEREIEILGLLTEGLSDREIAERLVMTVNTIKWYNRQIYSKLGVSSRTQAAMLARDRQPPSLPTQYFTVESTHFIGRRYEIDAIMRLLDTVRLLTLVGSPGTGKTRLALQIAGKMAPAFPDGIYFVSLAPINNATLVMNAIASAVGINEVPGQPLIETLKPLLYERRVLLILDNFEHLISAAPQVSELLSVVPYLKVLATSREPLHLYGEQEFTVPPLDLPDPEGLDPRALVECESTALFIQRARAVRPDFEVNAENALDIAKICVRLEGLPLAIELAASRIKLLTPRSLLSRLMSRLDTLTGGAHDLPVRQQTLRNTIEWSYNLLSEDEKTLFARLAIFAGGWTLEAAEVICAENLSVTLLDGLASLMDKCLIQPTGEDSREPRFTMLETIREYALERLKEQDREEALRARHASYFTVFAERAVHAFYSSAGLTDLEAEHNNFRAVLSWSLAGDLEPGLRLIAALGVCWRVRSHLVEGFNWAQRLLEKGINVAPAIRANALSSTSRLLACYVGDYSDAERMSREALDLARKSSDTHSIASALYARGSALLEADPAEARLLFGEALALFRSLDDQLCVAQTINCQGEVARLEADDDAAEQYYQEALALFSQFGNPWGANIVLQNLAYIAQHHKDYERARMLFVDSLRLSQELSDSLSIANCLAGLAGIVAILGQKEQAAQLFGAAEGLRIRLGAHIAPSDRLDYEANLAFIRAGLGTDTFETCWNVGREMSFEEMISQALQQF